MTKKCYNCGEELDLNPEQTIFDNDWPIFCSECEIDCPDN